MQILFSRLKKVSIIVLFFLCQSASGQSFILNGSIEGIDTGTAVLKYVNANNQLFSGTTTINQGKFQFKGMVNRTDYALLLTDPFNLDEGKTNWKAFFIEPGVMNIAFSYGYMDSARITGSKLQEKLDALHKQESKELNEIKQITSSADSIRSHLKNGTIDPQLADQKMKDLNKRYAPIQQAKLDADLSYISSHSNDYLSLMLLKNLIGRIPNDSVDIGYLKLSDKVKNSSLNYAFLEYYSRYKKAMGNDFPFDKIKINEPAPTFTLYTTATDSTTIDAFKGSVVLLEFWELTCLPCLQANPLIENLRKQYDDKGFKVIAINSTSVQELPKLMSYINKNNLSKWTHVDINSGFKEAKNSILDGDFKNYYKIGVPKTILIDRNGRVIYKNDGYSQGDMDKVALLVSKAN